MENNKNRSVPAVIGKIVLTAVLAAAVFFAGSFVVLLCASEDIALPLAYVVGYLLPALLFPVIWLKRRKTYAKIWLAAAAVCIVAVGVNFAMVRHDESIRINTSSGEYIYEVTADDAFVFIVHKDNPVDHLTAQQARDIYSGKIANWNEVGGENRKIKAYQCEKDSVNQTMMELFMGDVQLMQPPVEMGYGYLYAWEELVSVYRNKPESIGYCFTSYVRDNRDVKLLSIDGIAPTQENIRNGSYPILTPASMIVGEE